MRMRIGFAIGAGVGYILGTRAGRERYEQIKQVAKRVFENPRVKNTAGRVQAQAVHLGNQARHMVQEKAGTLAEKVGGKLPGPMSHLANRLARSEQHAETVTMSANGMPES